MIDFNFDFYNINKCGFYQRGHNAPSFGDISLLLTDFEEWITGKLVQNTKTYEAKKYVNKLPTYCKGFYRDEDTGDALLTTWNETMNEDGTVFSISGASQVGETEVSSTPVPDGNIPGYATYFWFIPERNIFCSVRPEGQTLNGHDNLKAYFKNFSNIWPRFCRWDDDNLFAGYSADPNADILPVVSKFETRVKTRITQLEGIRGRVDEIIKVVTKNDLHLRNEVKRGFMRSILDTIYLTDRNEGILVDKSYKLEFQYSPTLDDLDRIIEGWNNVQDESDIGFIYSGSGGTPIWLSHTAEKHQLSLDLQRNPGEVFAAQDIFDSIRRQRNWLLDTLS